MFLIEDERLGRAVKLNSPTEESYVFKDQWPSGFAAFQPQSSTLRRK